MPLSCLDNEVNSPQLVSMAVISWYMQSMLYKLDLRSL